MILKKWIDGLLSLLFPQTCVVCGGRLAEGEKYLCIECNMKLPRTHDELHLDNYMARMLWGRVEIVHAGAFFFYSKNNNYKHLLHDLKYHNQKGIGICIGRLMASEIEPSGIFEGIDYMVPVPLHYKRYKKRGYNQSEWIAKGISQITNIPIDTTSVIRTVNTSTQTKKNAMERAENMKDVFQCIHPEALANKHILIIDDVFTTGATTASCAQAIQKSTKTKISIYTMSRVQKT